MTAAGVSVIAAFLAFNLLRRGLISAGGGSVVVMMPSAITALDFCASFSDMLTFGGLCESDDDWVLHRSTTGLVLCMGGLSLAIEVSGMPAFRGGGCGSRDAG